MLISPKEIAWQTLTHSSQMNTHILSLGLEISLWTTS